MAAKNLIKTCQACQYGERRTKEGQKTFYGKFSMARKPISTRRDLGWKGVNFALFADNATGVDLCVFDSAAGEKEVRRYNPNKLLIDPYAKAIASAVGWHEIGKTQQGNNNAYCQDNELSWIDRQRAAWGSEVERIIFIQMQPTKDSIDFKLLRNRYKEMYRVIDSMALLTASSQLRSSGQRARRQPIV